MMIAAFVILSLLLLVPFLCDYCLYGRVKKSADSNENSIRTNENMLTEDELEYFRQYLKIVNHLENGD